MNFLNFLRWKSKGWKTTVWDSNDSNKTRMGSVLSRDLFRVGFFGAEAELRLGFAFRSMLDRISPQFPSLFFLFALSQFCGPDYLGAWNSLPPRQSEKTGVSPRRLTLCRLVEKKSKICDWDCCANKQRKQSQSNKKVIPSTLDCVFSIKMHWQCFFLFPWENSNFEMSSVFWDAQWAKKT